MPIARLIADDAHGDRRIADILAALPGAHAAPLAHGVIEIVAGEALSPKALRQAVEACAPGCDALFATGEVGVPGLFVSDMDSTMIGQECIDELADYAGLKPQIAAITERAMQGELDFRAALKERVALLAGLEEDAIHRCLAERIRLEPGAAALVAALRAQGCRTVLVTGGFHHFADVVAGWAGFDRVVGNRLEVAGGRLTGRLEGPIADSETKRAVLAAESAALGPGTVTLATGDGANDIPMLEAATYGIAYRAKPKARAAANGFVDTGDLTAILRLLGIAPQEGAAG